MFVSDFHTIAVCKIAMKTIHNEPEKLKNPGKKTREIK